jgi:hypothetical protein
MNHSLKTENRLQICCATGPQSLLCHYFITTDPKAVLRWYFAVCQTTTLWTKFFFFAEKIHFMRNWRSKVTSGDTEMKSTVSDCELYISEKNISLAFKQAPYEHCSLYRTKIMIIFSGDGVPKNVIFMIFIPPTPQILHDMGTEIFQEYYFLWSL